MDHLHFPWPNHFLVNLVLVDSFRIGFALNGIPHRLRTADSIKAIGCRGGEGWGWDSIVENCGMSLIRVGRPVKTSVEVCGPPPDEQRRSRKVGLFVPPLKSEAQRPIVVFLWVADLPEFRPIAKFLRCRQKLPGNFYFSLSFSFFFFLF